MISPGHRHHHWSGRTHASDRRQDNGNHACGGRRDNGDHTHSPLHGPSCHRCCHHQSGHVRTSVNARGSRGVAAPLIHRRGSKNASAKASETIVQHHWLCPIPVLPPRITVCLCCIVLGVVGYEFIDGNDCRDPLLSSSRLCQKCLKTPSRSPNDRHCFRINDNNCNHHCSCYH